MSGAVPGTQEPYVDIQEYLLLKGVEAVAIHGSKCTPLLASFDLCLIFSI
jgi:hypothetical protein